MRFTVFIYLFIYLFIFYFIIIHYYLLADVDDMAMILKTYVTEK